MIRPLLLAALPVAVWVINAKPVWPEPYTPLESHVIAQPPGEDDGSIAWIVHVNGKSNSGLGSERVLTFEVEGYGEIVVHVQARSNPLPDTVTVIDWPPGLAVTPMEVTTDEGERSILKVWRAGV